MTDALLRLFNDGGNIEYINGSITLSDGLETSVLLSMFGGNERDSGQQVDDLLQWWGNLSERDPDRKYRSQTQALTRSIPLVPANLRRFEDAAGVDLAWMVDSGLARFVRVTASIPTVNRLRLDVSIQIQDEIFRLAFLVGADIDGVQSIGVTPLLVDDFDVFIVDDDGAFIQP